LSVWNAKLDPNEIRKCSTAPEVAHIAQDSLTEEADSFYSFSMNSIMAFEVSEIYIPTGKSKKCPDYPITPINTAIKIHSKHVILLKIKYKL
jgi:hypothetical protein